METKNNKKFIYIIVAIIAMIIVFFIVSKISNGFKISKGLKEANSYAKKEVENICSHYGIDDYEIELYEDGDVYKTFVAAGRFYITSDKYMTLSAQDALDMMCELANIEYEYSGITFDYDEPTIHSNNHYFKYRFEYSRETRTSYFYVMMDNDGSVITAESNADTDFDHVVIWTDTDYFK